MPAELIPNKQLVGTAGLVTIYGPVAAGRKARVDLRACNITAPEADAFADVYVLDTVTGANSGYRARNFHIPPKETRSAPDLEYGLPLTEGMALQIRASAVNAIAFSLTGVEDDV